MFSKRNIERLTGAVLVAGFTAFLGHGVTLGTLGAGPTTLLLVLLYGFLIFLSAMTVYQIFSPYERTLAGFAALGLAAHGLFIVLTVTLLLAGMEFPDEFALSFGAGKKVGGVLELAMDRIRTTAFIFLGLSLMPLGILIVRSGAVARWMGWLGLVGGVFGFVGLLAQIFKVIGGVPAAIVSMTALLCAFGFILILGIRLLMRETREATTFS